MSVISETMIKFLNFRIKQEEYSSRLYLAMSVWLNFKGYVGASSRWKTYSEEEQKHANWAYEYLLDLDIKPTVQEIKQPANDFKSLPGIIMLSYKHEVTITNECQALAKAALNEGDFLTLGLAQQYVKEQIEELAKTQYWIDKLKAFGTDKIALKLLDDEMGA